MPTLSSRLPQAALLALTALLVTSCGNSTPPTAGAAAEPAAGVQASEPAPSGKLVMASGAMDLIYKTEFGGGRCVLKHFREIGTNSNYFEVIHRNGNRVRLDVKMWTPYQAATWDYNDSTGSIYRGYSWALSLAVHAACKVDGAWVDAPVRRVN